MMKMENTYTNLYNSIQMETIKRLAEIEQEDANCCAHCGGEDCICCEIYLDRQKWVSPEELFAEDRYDDYYDEENEDDFWCEDDDIY